jgi:hypothetical protein
MSLALTVTAFAWAQAQPSERACLTAWNAPANHANQLRLLAQRTLSGVQLLPGRVVTEVTSPACLLTLLKSGRIRVVAGRWHQGHVNRWSWGRSITNTHPFLANVRLLPSGHLAKIYRH